MPTLRRLNHADTPHHRVTFVWPIQNPVPPRVLVVYYTVTVDAGNARFDS